MPRQRATFYPTAEEKHVRPEGRVDETRIAAKEEQKNKDVQLLKDWVYERHDLMHAMSTAELNAYREAINILVNQGRPG